MNQDNCTDDVIKHSFILASEIQKHWRQKGKKIDILTEDEGQTKLNVHRELTENDKQAMSGQTKK